MNIRSAVGRLVIVVPFVVLVGCSSAASTPAPPSPPSPSAPQVSAPTSVGSAEDAAAAVLAAYPPLSGLEPFDPDKIGQCCFYRAIQTADGWTVTAQVGWGDCPSGCINRHTWTFAVDANGNVTLTAESGPAVPPGAIPAPSPGAAGASGAAGSGGAGAGTLTGPGIEGVASAGPTCPVQRPNDPACADRPIPGATIHVMAADGTEVATLTTDGAGRFAVKLDPGTYRLVADPVASAMRAPAPLDVTVGAAPSQVRLSYDTGIR